MEIQLFSDHELPHKGSLRKIKEIAAQKKREGILQSISKPLEDEKLIAEL